MGDDWLDDLKEKDAGESDDERRRQESQLHDYRTIRSRTPTAPWFFNPRTASSEPSLTLPDICSAWCRNSMSNKE
jgi:hypothetical protein